MALFTKDVWKALRPACKAKRTTLIVVPSRSYMLELLAHAFDEPDATGMRHLSMFCVKVNFLNFAVTVMVQNYHGTALVQRIHEYTIGQVDTDLVLVDCTNVSEADKRSLHQIMSARFGTLSVMVSK